MTENSNFDINEMGAQVAVNIITEIFKASLAGFKKADEWFRDKNKKYDFFGSAARKYAEQIELRYGTMKIFGMSEPVSLRSIFTRVNILKKITACQRLTLEDLEKFFNHDKRGFGIKRESISGIEAVNNMQKFIILGKPGAGKTTFLKYLVLQSAEGKLKQKRVPIFIGLKDFSESNKSLTDFITMQFDICHFKDARPFIEWILNKGKCLLLFDGLDEVSEDKIFSVISQIKDISDKYNNNQFIVSCRIAAYNYCFEKFTDVEMADFDDAQIESFINNWFGKGTQKAKLCWQMLNKNIPIKELASIPLLLTMLCLAFDGTMGIPLNKTELYKEALDALLKKWDSSRAIKRTEIYQHLSVRRKESMFSRIAAITFEKDQYFFPQQTLERYIADFIKNLPEANEKTIEPDSEAILKAIEAQHGIFVERAKGFYSFSHLTFQEYFTAKYYVDNAERKTLAKILENRLTDNKWREIFVLIAGMVDDADDFFLLMKRQVDALALERRNRKLSKFIEVICREIVKSDSLCTRSACRAAAFIYAISFYRDRAAMRDIVRDLERGFTFARFLYFHLANDLALEFGRTRDKERRDALSRASDSINSSISALNYDFEDAYSSDLASALDREFARDLANDLSIANDLDIFLESDPDLDREDLKTFLIYLEANQLIIECLSTECYVSKQIRQKILDELLTIS